MVAWHGRLERMNKDEQIAEGYLKSLDLGAVIYEPDGKVPPDFLVDGRIAVEVRRLNQHYEVDGKLRGLEQDSIALQQSIEKLLNEFATPEPAATWFACFSFRRPVLEWKTLRTLLRDALSSFLRAPTDHLRRIAITESFDLTIIRSTEAHEKCFLFGACTDMDAGGWIVSEVIRNASAFISAKSLKVEPYLDRYPIWWLVLVDYIALGGEEDDVRKHISRLEPWDRVVILGPSGERSYQV
jgi:hypothetical protein